MKWIDIWGDKEFQALSEYVISFFISISKAEKIFKNCEESSDEVPFITLDLVFSKLVQMKKKIYIYTG